MSRIESVPRLLHVPVGEQLGPPCAAGIDPARDRTSQGWAVVLREQAEPIIAADFFETVTLTGARMYVLAVIREVRPTAV